MGWTFQIGDLIIHPKRKNIYLVLDRRDEDDILEYAHFQKRYKLLSLGSNRITWLTSDFIEVVYHLFSVSP